MPKMTAFKFIEKAVDIHGDLYDYSKMIFGELYGRTLEKERIYSKNGYRISYIWESEWKKKEKKEMNNYV